jgi:hypothetical protein
MARGKLTMKRCPNGKLRKCAKKYKKCTLKRLNPKAKSFKKNKLNPKAKSFKMGGKKHHKGKKISAKSKKDKCECTSNVFMGIGFDMAKMNKKNKKVSKKTGGKKKSSYNKFMSKELKRIKRKNPKINHNKAFMMAAKNWKK